MAKVVETWRGVAYPWFCDSLGHMNTQFYQMMFDGATFHFLSLIASYNALAGQQRSWADVRYTTEYKHEIRAGALLIVRSHLVRVGTKSVEFMHTMSNAETDALHATCSGVSVLFDLAARKALALDEAMRARGAALLEG
ncbi:MAG: acyl-CoA thioesterase [Alphaproteobacteria bacterium]